MSNEKIPPAQDISMSARICRKCGSGFILPSGICDHCDQQPAPAGMEELGEDLLAIIGHLDDELAKAKADAKVWYQSYNTENLRVQELQAQNAHKTRQVDSLYIAREEWQKRAEDAESRLADLLNGDLTP